MKRLTECTSVDHVKDTSWCPDHNMYTVLESCHVFTHICASDTGVAVSLQVITQCDHNLSFNMEVKFNNVVCPNKVRTKNNFANKAKTDKTI